MYPRALPCGDCALTIELGDVIDSSINDDVMALDQMAREMGPPILDTVPTYRSLLVTYDPAAIDFETLADDLIAKSRQLVRRQSARRHWQVPVVYGGQFGIDLGEFAERHDLPNDEVVRRHSSAIYRVYTIGFMPGFTYLGGLDQTLATPRRATPRLSAPEGSVTIGGSQTAITSIELPSGWHIVGRSPVRAFMAARDPVCLFAVGDLVTFHPVSSDEWPALALAAHKGELVAKAIE